MNGRERVMTAVSHREPDRAPITFDAQPEVYGVLYRHFGISIRSRWQITSWKPLFKLFYTSKTAFIIRPVTSSFSMPCSLSRRALRITDYADKNLIPQFPKTLSQSSGAALIRVIRVKSVPSVVQKGN